MSRSSVHGMVVLTCLVMLAGGCAHKTEEALPRLFWPPPPGEPRVEFFGTYVPRMSTVSAEERETGSGARTLIREIPVDLIADSHGFVYLTEKDLRNIIVHHRGSRDFDLLFKQAPLESPYGLAMDDDGLLYISDSAKLQILVFTPKGELLLAIRDTDHLSLPTNLAVSSRYDRIFVSDEKADRVVVFDRRGQYLYSIGKRGTATSEFRRPRGLALDRKDHLYVADADNGRIQVFDVDGHHLSTLGGKGSALPLLGPSDIAFDSDGHIYIVDEKKNALFIFAEDGSLLLVVGSGSPSAHTMGFSHPSSIHIDSNDRIYIVDCFNGRFSVWQYLNATYLQTHAITTDDRDKLIRYIATSKPKEKDGQTEESLICFWGLCIDTAPMKAASNPAPR